MKKIAVNTVKNFMKEHAANAEDVTISREYPIGDESFEVQIKTKLSLDERSVFIRRVLSGCFDSTGSYLPEYFSPMFHATILQMCTNLPPLTMKGEQGENGQAIMDIDAMDQLYIALGLDEIAELTPLREKMNRLTVSAVRWYKERSLRELADSEVKSAASAIRGVVEEIATKVADINSEDLMRYAAELTDRTRELGDNGIVDGLIRAHEERTDS